MAAAPPHQQMVPDRSALEPQQRDAVLPRGWRSSRDLVWTTNGDATGFHLLVAQERTGYAWRTIAWLSEPGVDTDRWIGNICLTESGRKAVAVYAARVLTNTGGLFQRGALTAVIDIATDGDQAPGAIDDRLFQPRLRRWRAGGPHPAARW